MNATGREIYFYLTGVVNLMRRVNRRSDGSKPKPLDTHSVRLALRALDGPRWGDLTRYLKVTRNQTQRLRSLLRGLERADEIRCSNGRYYLDVGETVIFDTVVENGGKRMLEQAKVELPARIDARVGDRVKAHIGEARIRQVDVVEPSGEPVIGYVMDHHRRCYVESLHPDIKGRIEIENGDPTVRDGDIVEVVLMSHDRGQFHGRVTSILETRDEADRAASALLASFRVPTKWPNSLSRLKVPTTISIADETNRVDLTKLSLVTIDGEDARDFDDAVFAERLPRRGWRLVVAIADVAHYVKLGSPLDAEARKRGNSVYLPDRVVPMLPESLANGICSLNPDEKRLAVVCDMTVSASGRVSKYMFYDAVIRSHARLTYEEVADKPDRFPVLFEVYRAFRKQREVRGALDLDVPESRLLLRDGRARLVQPVRRNDAHRLIEETMIAANICAARHLESLNPIYRVHEPPVKAKRDQLREAFNFAGIRLGDDEITPRSLQSLVDRAQEISNRPAWIIGMMVLRSMSQARYDTCNKGHFGLALPKYTHFTSPIRRYADLTVHRMIKSGNPIADVSMDQIATHTSVTERRAEHVSRGVVDWLKCDFIADRVGETFSGIVVGVTEFGLFVELVDFAVQGLVHISKIGRDYYQFVPESMSLVAERSGDRFTLGDALDVVVNDVSVEKRRVDLVLPRSRRRK